MKNKTMLVLGAIVACAVCGVPLMVPFVVGLAGGGALAGGQWILGGALAALAFYFLGRWLQKSLTNSTKSQSAMGCCGEE